MRYNERKTEYLMPFDLFHLLCVNKYSLYTFYFLDLKIIFLYETIELIV